MEVLENQEVLRLNGTCQLLECFHDVHLLRVKTDATKKKHKLYHRRLFQWQQ